MDLATLHDLAGWMTDDDRRRDRIAAVYGRSAFGVRSLYDANPNLRGYGKGKTVALFRAFDLIGHGLGPYVPQTRGTCVGRAGARCGDLIQARQTALGKGQWEARMSSEAVYGFARVEVGGGGGRGDGAVVAEAVEACCTFGLLPRRAYPQYDLTGPDDDDLAARWGSRGVPDDLEPEARKHVFRAWASIGDAEEARDALAAGFVLWLGTSKAYWRRGRAPMRDARGFLTIVGTTAHSWIVSGVADDGGRPAFCHDNRSWGDDWVEGPDGRELFPGGIPAGCFISGAEDFEATIAAGECYAVSDLAGFDPAILPNEAHLLV